MLVLLRQTLVGFGEELQLLLGRIADGLQVAQPDHGVLGQLGEEGLLPRRILILKVGHDHGLGQALDGELVLRVEAAHALHGVAIELDAVGLVAAVAEHIHDATADAVLPRLVHELHTAEAGLLEPFLQRVDGQLLVALHGERVLRHLFLADHQRDQCIGVGDDEKRGER